MMVDVKSAVMTWFAAQDTDFYGAGIEKLAPRLAKLFNKFGDYVEKLYLWDTLKL